MTSCRWIRGLALLGAIGCGTGLPPAPPPSNPIRFIAMNDVGTADTLDDGSGGLARVATMRKRIAEEGPTLLVAAGNLLAPRPTGVPSGARQVVDAFNTAGLNYATFGPADFARDRDSLVAWIGASRFKWLSANCTDSGGRAFPGVASWDTVRLAARKVGLFGVTAPGAYAGYVRCSAPDSAARAVLDALTAQGAELIVAITHQPIDADRDLLNREARIDLILGGSEPAAQSVQVSGRYVIKADPDLRTVQFATVWGSKGHWRQAVVLLPVHPGIPLDPSTAAVVAAAADSAPSPPS